MSEALSSLAVTFDDPPRHVHASSAGHDGDAPQTIAATLRAAGIDAPCSLYNEAIELARQGHLGQSVSRLQMLLGLDPDDADALLLLSKVHAAQGRPQEALARLDAAVAASALAPAGFRDYLESALRAERMREEEHRARVGAREQGEIKALRTEARQLRSENVRLETELGEATDRERSWKIGAIAASAIGTLVIIALIAAAASPGADPVVPTASNITDIGAEPSAVAPGVDPVAPVAPTAVAPTAVAPTAVTPAPAAPSAVTPAATAAPTQAAPAEATPTAKATAKSKGKHVVVAGDTLGSLAARYYGDASQWTKIAAANKATLKGKTALALGQSLIIP